MSGRFKSFVSGLAGVAALVSFSSPGVSHAETIGYSSPRFDDNFQTTLRLEAKRYAESLGHSVQIEDAREDVSTQLSQVQNFIASGVDAIILGAVSAAATPQITALARAANTPLVYINRSPIDLANIGGSITFVGSDETWSGTMSAFEICKLSSGSGNAILLMGILSNEAAITRSEDVREVLKLSMCKGIKIISEQEGQWQRTKASDIVTNLLSSNQNFSIVFANNDEMALGAIQALKAAGKNMADYYIGGVDATADALAAMKAGDLDVTVFQNAKAQARGSVDAALRAIRGENLPNWVKIPFEAVTPDNLEQYLNRN